MAGRAFWKASRTAARVGWIKKAFLVPGPEDRSMNRRTFFAGSATTAALAVTEAAYARGTRSLRVLIPPLPPEELRALREAAPDVELIVCRDPREALEQVNDADAS